MAERVFKPETGALARAFESAWCEHCARHGDDSSHSGCWILFAASIYDADSPDFPQVWVVGDDGPECRAFEARPFPSDAADHPEYSHGFVDAMADEMLPRESGFYYLCGHAAGRKARATFERSNLLVGRGVAGFVAEGGR